MAIDCFFVSCCCFSDQSVGSLAHVVILTTEVRIRLGRKRQASDQMPSDDFRDLASHERAEHIHFHVLCVWATEGLGTDRHAAILIAILDVQLHLWWN
jgi:hypothetical protein